MIPAARKMLLFPGRTLQPLLLSALFMELLLLPSQLGLHLGSRAATTLTSLGVLATIVASLTVGARVGALAGLGLGLVVVLGDQIATQPISATTLMTLLAFGLGLTARWRLQTSLVLLPMTVAFVMTQQPTAPGLESMGAFGIRLGLMAALAALIASGAQQLGGRNPQTHPVTHSWRRTLAYAVLLAVTTLITSGFAFSQHWGHTGGWLIATPLFIEHPYIKQGWKLSLHRIAGTIAGFLLVHLLAILLPDHTDLDVIGALIGVMGALSLMRRWPYAIYILFLTGTVVIFSNSGHSILITDRDRLLATAIAVALSLVLMACSAGVQWLFRNQMPQDDPPDDTLPASG